MEPTIYKPGAYKSPGIYKGAGGIYKGRGVYNDGNYVKIGGKNYPFVKIGNLFFTSLSYNVNTANSILPEIGTDIYGLLYPAYDIFNEILPILPTGWRVPDESDFVYIKNNISNLSNDYISQENGGNDITGFNAKLLGYRNKDNNFVYKGIMSLFWSKTIRNETTTYDLSITKDSYIDDEDYGRGTNELLSYTSFEIRFCKDV